MAGLNQLAKLLVKTYDLDLLVDVEALLLLPEHLLDLTNVKPDALEQVFVYQPAGQTPELGLYLAPRVQHTLALHSPFDCLNQTNLAALMYAIEGISHVVWLSWCLQKSFNVRQIELEMQAEVDKFVVGYILHGHHGSNDRATLLNLSYQLFNAAQLDYDLSAQERERYVVSSRAALRFVETLVQPTGPSVLVPDWLAQVRRFGRSSKIAQL